MNRMATRWPRMTWPARAASVAAIALALCGCRTEVDLHTGLTDADANRVVTALLDDGMQANKRPMKGGVTVSVAESDLARATAVLAAQGLPHLPAARMGDVFKKEGLISSPLEERARYIYALSQEIESTLAQIDGVVVARVHVVLPEKVAPGEPMQPPSAAVFIKHLPILEPDAISHRVKQLVARSVPGLGAQGMDRVSAVFVVAEAVPQRHAEAPSQAPMIAALLALLGIGTLATGAFLLVRKNGWRPWPRPAAAPAAAAAATPARPSTLPAVPN
jgi:type III secretion protein J